MAIRQADLGDIVRLEEMARRFLASTPYGGLILPAPGYLEHFCMQVLKQGVVLVADVGGRTVGMLALLIGTHLLTGDLAAEEVVWWVEPEHRAGGIGPELLAAAERWASAKNVSVLKMVAPGANPSVGRFYAARGYLHVESIYIRRL